ncbi:glycosyl transferase, partial [Coprinellus micaceus]
GERVLSREYYYLRMQLPIDRLLTSYHGPPGFRPNNVLAVSSVQVFILTSQLSLFFFSDGPQHSGGRVEYYNLVPAFEWVERCIISIFLKFMISSSPLFL